MNLTRREFFDRYGPSVGVVVTLILLVTLMPGSRSQSTSSVGSSDTGQTGSVAESSKAGSLAPTTGSQIASRGVSVASGIGKLPTGGRRNAHCRSDGRTDGIDIYQAPCVPAFVGDNGGNTARGVTRDKIVVAVYYPQATASSQALDAAIGTDQQNTETMYEGLRRYFNNHTETYGREIVFVKVDASGPATNDEAARSDAIKIAKQTKAFAVLASSGPETAFMQELSARGVVVIDYNASGGRPRSFYARNQGIFSRFPVLEEFYGQGAEYIGKRLARRNAKWSGDMQAQPRKFGLVYEELPGAAEGVKYFRSELARNGGTLEVAIGYSPDPSQAQEQASGVISKLKAAHVTTVALATDYLFPVFLTRQADSQLYNPEWFSMFPVLDTITLGRTYSQTQWVHAFGISSILIPSQNIKAGIGPREFRHGMPESTLSDKKVAFANGPNFVVNFLALGIQMAGPKLTRDTFIKGMYGFPRTGGTPVWPSIQFTSTSPGAIKDFREIYWDRTRTCTDELENQAVGCWVNAEGGRRYLLGGWPRLEPQIFNGSGPIKLDNPAFPHERNGHMHKKRCMSCST